MPTGNIWQIRTDTGGTFTDCHALAPDGVARRMKLLSSGVLRLLVRDVSGTPGGVEIRLEGLPAMPDGFFAGFRLTAAGGGSAAMVMDSGPGWVKCAAGSAEIMAGDMVELGTGEEAPVVAARMLTATPVGGVFPEIDFRVATTRGTNALLEGKGASVVFFTNRGFGDLLAIGDQRRPDLFAICPELPPPLHCGVVEVAGRMDAGGREIEPMDDMELALQARRALERWPDAMAAVALLHASRNPAQELRARRVLLEAGFSQVACSSELAPFIKLLPRAQTAVVEAALAPVLRGFTDGVAGPLGLAGRGLWLMTSAGGLAPAADFHAKDGLLSGPAGGVVGAAAVARALGWEKVLTLDMGGTSTDVARIDGGFTYQFEHQVGGARLLFPSVKIETVAAGGGSICRWADGRLRVGPESAGAEPGPACYGKGGPLTVTDVNLLLGYFNPEHAPIPVFRAPAEARLAELAAEVASATGQAVEPMAMAAGMRRIAIETMADAIRAVSLREGVDPADYALLAFGGAGPQHACEVAAALGMRTVLVPGDAGLLSAFGLHHAVIERHAGRQVLAALDEVETRLPLWLEDLEREAMAAVRAEAGEAAVVVVTRRIAEVRLHGQESALVLESGGEGKLRDRFASAFEALFHYPPPARPLELVALRVAAATVSGALEREETGGDIVARGPAMRQDGFSTCVIPAGWSMRLGTRGSMVIERDGEAATAGADAAASAGAVETELFRARFAAVAEEMGALLERTALSTNIRERLDFSCALLDPDGRLVVNAPHIPVHLGALGVCVRSLLQNMPMEPGDVVVTNHPAHGGSHLPDVTLVAPVHDAAGRLAGYVANRAHHAELGGKTPGSMPPDATCLAEEGVVVTPRYLARRGITDWHDMEELLKSGPYPSRNPAENLADLQAQLSALVHARRAVRHLADVHGSAVLRQSMESMAAQSAGALRAALGRMDWTASRVAEDSFDDGAAVRVILERLANGRLHVDFSGTSGRHAGNFNATPAIVTSAVIYVLRLVAGGDIPLNDGLLSEVDISIPRDSMLSPDFCDDPEKCPAVVAGNVETSQHIVNALIKAFGLAACSQGTMNNVLFGNAGFAHYETLGGGCGAADGRAGASGRHSHMTNTAITDPEIIEHRFPVRLRQFSLRHGSGGHGRWPGGDGLAREYAFLAPLTVSLLTSKRASGPDGAAGGGAGQPGRNLLRRAGAGDWRELPGVTTLQAGPGDRVRVETPGGGAWGACPPDA